MDRMVNFTVDPKRFEILKDNVSFVICIKNVLDYQYRYWFCYSITVHQRSEKFRNWTAIPACNLPSYRSVIRENVGQARSPGCQLRWVVISIVQIFAFHQPSDKFISLHILFSQICLRVGSSVSYRNCWAKCMSSACSTETSRKRKRLIMLNLWKQSSRIPSLI